jgi:predicted membrane protein
MCRDSTGRNFQALVCGNIISACIYCILFDQELGLENYTPWPVLGIALLASIGLSLIFKPLRQKIKKPKNQFCESGNYEEVSEESGEIVDCHVKFGSSMKYVNSENFCRAELECSFGALKIYFDNAKIPSGKGEIVLDVSFAGVEIYVPREWKLILEADTTFGAIEEKGPKYSTEEGPVVLIKGKVSFSGVDIRYI